MQKLILIGMVAVMCACAPKVTVTVDNTLDTDRSAELVEIPVSGLDKITLAEGQTYVVTGGDGKVVPLQVLNL